MRFLTLLLSGYLLLLGCLPPNTDAHEIMESMALRNHHEQAHHDSSLLDFLLDHYAGQSHGHDSGDGDREHQSLPFHHAHDCVFALVAWTAAPVIVPSAPPTFRLGEMKATAYGAGASVGVPSTCWQPPRA